MQNLYNIQQTNQYNLLEKDQEELKQKTKNFIILPIKIAHAHSCDKTESRQEDCKCRDQENHGF